MSGAEFERARANGELEALKRGVDIRRGDKLSRDQWREAVDNLTPEEFGQARADGLLEGLDRLLDKTGAATSDATTSGAALVTSGSADQGGRGGSRPLGQVKREELAGMSLSEYEYAKRDGRLSALLRGES